MGSKYHSLSQLNAPRFVKRGVRRSLPFDPSNLPGHSFRRITLAVEDEVAFLLSEFSQTTPSNRFRAFSSDTLNRIERKPFRKLRTQEYISREEASSQFELCSPAFAARGVQSKQGRGNIRIAFAGTILRRSTRFDITIVPLLSKSESILSTKGKKPSTHPSGLARSGERRVARPTRTEIPGTEYRTDVLTTWPQASDSTDEISDSGYRIRVCGG